MLVDFFNALFQPWKLFEADIRAAFMPLLIILFYGISPVIQEGWRAFVFLIAISYLSAAFRIIFDKNNSFYVYLICFSPLIFGMVNSWVFIFALAWSEILKIYAGVKNKNYLSIIAGLIFDCAISWWYLIWI